MEQNLWRNGNEQAVLLIVQTSDGGYAVTGSTSSFGAGGNDAYLVKTDASGTMQWNRTYGGTSTETWGLHYSDLVTEDMH